MLEPHHFVTQPFRHPFPLLCMLSTPSKYSAIKALLLKCWIWKCRIPLPKNLMSLAENLSSVWSFFPLKLWTSPMPRTSHQNFHIYVFLFHFWLSKTFRMLLFHSHAHAYLLFSFWKTSWVSLSNRTYFRLLKTTPWNLMHRLPYVKWISSLSSYVHFWTNETKFAPHLDFCPNLGFAACVFSILYKSI